jgi:hypothetical protein
VACDEGRLGECGTRSSRPPPQKTRAGEMGSLVRFVSGHMKWKLNARGGVEYLRQPLPRPLLASVGSASIVCGERPGDRR